MGTQLPSQKGGSAPLIFCPFLLWPNGWMHQDGTWYGGRPQPRRRCVRWGPNPLPKKGWSHPNFGPRLLWPNGCIDQAVTWYGGRPRPTRRCVRWGTSSPPLKGHSPPSFRPNFVVAEWTKMPLGMAVVLDSGDFVFDADPVTPKKAHPRHPIFGLCLLWPNGWIGEDASWYGSRPRPRPHCIRRCFSSRERGTAAPLFSAHVYCGHGRPSELMLSSCF